MSGNIGIDNLSPNITELGSVDDRLVLIRVPTGPANLFILLAAIGCVNILVMRYCESLEVHIDQDFIAQPNESALTDISVDLRVFGKAREYNMFSDEFGFVFVKSIRQENWNIVTPSVSWCGR